MLYSEVKENVLWKQSNMLRLAYDFHIKQYWWVRRDEIENIFKEDKVKGHYSDRSNYVTI